MPIETAPGPDSKLGQVQQVYQQPREPGQPSRNVDPAEIGNRRGAVRSWPCCPGRSSENARGARFARQGAAYDLAHVTPLLHGDRREAGQPVVGDRGQSSPDRRSRKSLDGPAESNRVRRPAVRRGRSRVPWPWRDELPARRPSRRRSRTAPAWIVSLGPRRTSRSPRAA